VKIFRSTVLFLPEVKYRERLLPVGEKSFVSGFPWLIDNDPPSSTVFSCHSSGDVSQKVWLSLIST